MFLTVQEIFLSNWQIEFILLWDREKREFPFLKGTALAGQEKRYLHFRF